MFVNIGFHYQFVMLVLRIQTFCAILAAKIRNKKENTKKFINFFKKDAIKLTQNKYFVNNHAKTIA